MPQYFFNVRGKELAVDTEGAEFADLDAAHDEAIRSAKEAIAHAMWKGERLSFVLEQTFEITDEAGTIVKFIPFAEAAEARGYRP